MCTCLLRVLALNVVDLPDSLFRRVAVRIQHRLGPLVLLPRRVQLANGVCVFVRARTYVRIVCARCQSNTAKKKYRTNLLVTTTNLRL